MFIRNCSILNMNDLTTAMSLLLTRKTTRVATHRNIDTRNNIINNKTSQNLIKYENILFFAYY